MKLTDIIEAPIDLNTHTRAASAGNGTITLTGANGIRVSIPMAEAIDPVTGLLARRYWGEGGRKVDSHLGAVED